MDRLKQLRNTMKSQAAQRPKAVVKLGDTISELMEKQISPRQARFEAVSASWGRLLPVELSRHCEIADISGGRMKVMVDSAVYAYELRLCSSELLGQLKSCCPRARIEKIDIVVGRPKVADRTSLGSTACR